MRPVDEKYPISLKYGAIYTKEMGVNPFLVGQRHKGVDYACPSGRPIKSPVDGILNSFTEVTGFGNRVVIKFFQRCGLLDVITYRVQLCHLQIFHPSLKKIGQKIKKGDVVAYSGNTGWSSAPHTHVQIDRLTNSGWIDMEPTWIVGAA